ncbi:MAG TPA: NUDIX domain-containing protein [Methyloceanibacter sp.]|nr:NUDIX domain-containing protein [Methyloceanibacter sp.]
MSVALFKGDEVLLVKRKDAPFSGLWSLPGGKMKPGEGVRHAALRELAEEVGLAAEIQGIIDIVTVAPNGDAGEEAYRLTVFYGLPSDGKLTPGGDAEEAEWVALDEIEQRPLTPGAADLIWAAVHKVRRSR